MNTQILRQRSGPLSSWDEEQAALVVVLLLLVGVLLLLVVGLSALVWGLSRAPSRVGVHPVPSVALSPPPPAAPPPAAPTAPAASTAITRLAPLAVPPLAAPPASSGRPTTASHTGTGARGTPKASGGAGTPSVCRRVERTPLGHGALGLARGLGFGGVSEAVCGVASTVVDR